MGHSSIQVTVDTYGHLIPGANVSFVDSLDQLLERPENNSATNRNPRATAGKARIRYFTPKSTDLIGGGAWTRTTDLRIMRPSL